MDLFEILFWVLTVAAIGCSLGVILSRNPINSVLFLIATFFAISGHYILMNAQFLAIVNIIVYAGAIMVLFLFVVMLMNLNADTEPPNKRKYLVYSGVIAGASLMLVLVAAVKKTTESNQLVQLKEGDVGLISNLGKTLFTEYVFPFEISSVLFLSAMIGAVIISKK